MQEETIFRSKHPNIDIPNHLPLHAYCFENISQFSKRPWLINSSTGDVYTYEEVELTSRKVAYGLLNIGIRKGDTIMLLLPNLPQFVFAFLGVSYAGALSTMANPLFTSAEIIKQATSSDTKLIITQACHIGKVRDYAMEKGIKLICIDEPLASDQEYCMHFSNLTRTTGPMNPIVEINPDDVVALPYSSGTTGLPKGVMVTHKALVTNIAQQVDGAEAHVDITCHDVMICVLPLFHVYALTSILLCGLRVGATILLVQKFEIVSLFELIEKHKVTVGYFVPPIFLAIAKYELVETYDLSSLRLVTSAAAPLGKDLEEAVRIKFLNAEIGQGYGMTEAGQISSMYLALTKEKSNIRSGSCGTLLRNAQVKIVDTETGASLGHNKPGEILLRSDQLMKGYLNDPESTKNSIDKNGWLHTGDVGFIDSEDQLFVVDRLKEIIKYKGFQVAPAELEDLLLNHPVISDVAVVGMQDEETGEVPVAFVVCSSGSTITEDEIKQFISKQVVFYKKIRHVVFVDVIPKSASGKILRKNLRKRLTSIV